jgi:hypothetical protein
MLRLRDNVNLSAIAIIRRGTSIMYAKRQRVGSVGDVAQLSNEEIDEQIRNGTKVTYLDFIRVMKNVIIKI